MFDLKKTTLTFMIKNHFIFWPTYKFHCGILNIIMFYCQYNRKHITINMPEHLYSENGSTRSDPI